MTFHIIEGDLFDPEHGFEGLAQGVNCEGIMGGGIAVAFRTRYPLMYESYKKLCDEYRDVIPGLLHTYDVWGEEPERKSDFPVIFNLFSQIQPGPDGQYALLKKAALLMRMEAESRNISRVGLPWIGCGIALLERHNVEHIFHRILGPSEVEFVLVQQP
jgi:O-acetyl-ADP-ribose deacetylase (regulator of RNase III)